MRAVRIFLSVVSAGLAVVGIAGLPDDLRVLAEWLAMIDHDLVRYCLVAAGFLGLAYLNKDSIFKAAAKAPFVRQKTTMPANWQEFEYLPLKYAACMWHGLPATDSSLRRPIIQEELVRLSLAVKQRKLEHRNGDTYHGALVVLGIDPANDQFTKQALVKYAKEADRDIPAFLRGTPAPDDEGV